MIALIERIHDLLHRELDHEGWDAHPDQLARLTGRNTGHARARATAPIPGRAAARAARWLYAGTPTAAPATPCHTGGTR